MGRMVETYPTWACNGVVVKQDQIDPAKPQGASRRSSSRSRRPNALQRPARSYAENEAGEPIREPLTGTEKPPLGCSPSMAFPPLAPGQVASLTSSQAWAQREAKRSEPVLTKTASMPPGHKSPGCRAARVLLLSPSGRGPGNEGHRATTGPRNRSSVRGPPRRCDAPHPRPLSRRERGGSWAGRGPWICDGRSAPSGSGGPLGRMSTLREFSEKPASCSNFSTVY